MAISAVNLLRVSDLHDLHNPALPSSKAGRAKAPHARAAGRNRRRGPRGQPEMNREMGNKLLPVRV